jgi:hypothetical protein
MKWKSGKQRATKLRKTGKDRMIASAHEEVGKAKGARKKRAENERGDSWKEE